MASKIVWRKTPATEMMLKQTYICPHCFRTVNVTYPATSIFNNIMLNNSKYFKGTACGIECNIKCERCNTLMFSCDVDIAKYISQFNKVYHYKYYEYDERYMKTVASCSGHHIEIDPWNVPDPNQISYIPYISIKGSNIDKVQELFTNAFNRAKEKYSSLNFDYIWLDYRPASANHNDDWRTGEVIGTAHAFDRTNYYFDYFTSANDFKKLKRSFLKYLEALVEVAKETNAN